MSAAEPVLRVDGLSVHAGRTGLVHDVTFTVGRDERVGLIGESGSGKSLTALAVMGLLPEGLGASGRVHLAGEERELLGLDERERSRLRGRRTAMIFQEPMTALNPTMRVGDQVAEVLLLHDLAGSRAAARGRAVRLLDDVGLPEAAQAARSWPHQLSGGQRQRVMTAIALAGDPDLLICDEPTTALDVTVQALVLDLITRGAAARDAGLLLITHDLGVVATVCERVLVLYGGRVVEAGPVAEVFTRPRHHYTAGLLAASDLRTDAAGRLVAIPGTVPGAGRLPAGCVFRDRCGRADVACEVLPPWDGPDPALGFACVHPVVSTGSTDGGGATPVEVGGSSVEPRVSSVEPRRDLDTAGGSPVVSTGSTGHVVSTDPEPHLRLTGVHREFTRPRDRLLRPAPVVRALRGVDLQVARGERFGIVGESGSGKSTLLRLVAGLDRPTRGTVEVSGRDISRLPERELGFLRRELQLVMQDPMGSLDPRMRVGDIVAEPLVAQGLAHPPERIAGLLQEVGLPPEAADRYPHQFSGGQRQRISIARALAPQPALLLADEPVSALDVSVRAQVLDLVLDLVARFGLTLVLVSHDLSVVAHVCDRVAVMKDGQVVETGSAQQVLTAPQHPYTRALVAAVPRVEEALQGRSVARLAADVQGAGS